MPTDKKLKIIRKHPDKFSAYPGVFNKKEKAVRSKDRTAYGITVKDNYSAFILEKHSLQ